MAGDLIKVTQLPVIEERLRSRKESVDQRIEFAMSLICDEEHVQGVKSNRAENRAEADYIKSQLKQAEEILLSPLEPIKKYCEDELLTPLKRLDEFQKQEISAVEDGIIKRRCEESLREYFAELCAVRHLDWLTYERAGIKVDMASAKAKTPKRLRDQLSAFVTRVGDDVDRIIEMDDADEIMVEFRRSLDASDAICTVYERHKRIDEERAAKEARAVSRAAEQEAVDRVIQVQKTYLQPPVVAAAEEKRIEVKLTMHPTKTQYEELIRPILAELKKICDREGIRYE